MHRVHFFRVLKRNKKKWSDFINVLAVTGDECTEQNFLSSGIQFAAVNSTETWPRLQSSCTMDLNFNQLMVSWTLPLKITYFIKHRKEEVEEETKRCEATNYSERQVKFSMKSSKMLKSHLIATDKIVLYKSGLTSQFNRIWIWCKPESINKISSFKWWSHRNQMLLILKYSNHLLRTMIS